MQRSRDNHPNESNPANHNTFTTTVTISTTTTVLADDKLHTSLESQKSHVNHASSVSSFNSSTTTAISTTATMVVDDKLRTSLECEKIDNNHTNEFNPSSFNSSTTTTTITTIDTISTTATVEIEDKPRTSLQSDNTALASSSSTKPHTPSNDPCWNAIHHVQSESTTTTLTLHDFSFIQRLGCGDIGTVYLVELKDHKGSMFAAKVMDKEELMNRNKENRSKIEREILEMLNHPFLPTLYTTLESERWSCLVTEFCPGGDLHVLRQRQPGRRFDEAAVRFYASEVVVALEYLHMMGIIYRDLKPENVLVRSDGHIMLTDFDLSLKCDNSTSTAHLVYDLPSSSDNNQMKKDYPMETPQVSTSSCILPSCITPAVSCFHPIKWHRRKRPPPRGSLKIVAEPIDARSMSFVGTYEYLAPEIVSGEGHGNSVDWWTLGIFIYELFYGITPFRGLDNEHTMANILARALEFPKEPTISNHAKDLITQLLVKDPTKRMGSIMGASSIKNHSFFDGVNWALLRCCTPPYVPRLINSCRDFISSYDHFDDLVEYF